MAQKVTKIGKGVALNTDPSTISFLGYNLLAPIYVRPIDARTGSVQEFAAFPWAEPADEVLQWSVRWPRMLQNCGNVLRTALVFKKSSLREIP